MHSPDSFEQRPPTPPFSSPSITGGIRAPQCRNPISAPLSRPFSPPLLILKKFFSHPYRRYSGSEKFCPPFPPRGLPICHENAHLLWTDLRSFRACLTPLLNPSANSPSPHFLPFLPPPPPIELGSPATLQTPFLAVSAVPCRFVLFSFYDSIPPHTCLLT